MGLSHEGTYSNTKNTRMSPTNLGRQQSSCRDSRATDYKGAINDPKHTLRAAAP